MCIWADADTCPKAIKEILFRTADRRRIVVTLVGEQAATLPNSAFIRSITVLPGFDSSDQKISLMLAEGDIVVTGDLALANSVLGKKAVAIGPRGETYDREDLKKRMAQRGFMPVERGAGITVKDSIGMREQQAFGALIEQLLNKTEAAAAAALLAKTSKSAPEALEDAA